MYEIYKNGRKTYLVTAYLSSPAKFKKEAKLFWHCSDDDIKIQSGYVKDDELYLERLNGINIKPVRVASYCRRR